MNLWEKIKAGLETPEKGAGTVTQRLTDIAVLTYMVPVERIVPLLPDGFVPDRLPNEKGELCAFVQTLCAFCQESRWSPAPSGMGESYREILYRILGRREKDRPGAYIFRSFYNKDNIYAAQRAIQRDADFIRASMNVSGDPVRGTFNGYKVRALADRGATEWEISPADGEEAIPIPFGKKDDMTRFLLHREAMYFAPSASPKGWLGYAPTALPTTLPEPTIAKLISARLVPWREAGVLSTDEMSQPQSVLFIPGWTSSAYPPRPINTAQAV